MCDGHEDCADHSDEMQCNDVVLTGPFYDKTIIHKEEEEDEDEEEEEGEHHEEEEEETKELTNCIVQLGKGKKVFGENIKNKPTFIFCQINIFYFIIVNKIII